MLRSLNQVFILVSTFDTNYGNMGFHGYQIGDKFTGKKRSIDIQNGTKWNVSG